jgi:hypothetical protein
MSSPFCNTYEDVISRSEAFLQSREKVPSLTATSIRNAIQSALREIVSAHDWNCLKRMWRVQLKGTQKDGTLTYLSSTGAFPYQITLTDAVFPSWARDASIRIGTFSLICEIDQVKSPTVATLVANSIPAQDFTTAQPFTLGLERYPLPAEFLNIATASERNSWFVGNYVPWVQYQQINKYRAYSGIVKIFSIGPNPKSYGGQCIYVHPWSQDDSEYDLECNFRPRAMAISGRESWSYAGKISTTAGSTSVVGVGTAFDSRMVGTMLRASADGTTLPTGPAGVNPFMFQQTVASVESTTGLTLSYAAPVALSSVKYTVSDPCDVSAAMYDVFIKGVECQLANFCGLGEYKDVMVRYQAALQAARAADLPARPSMVVGESPHVISRLRDFKTRSWI